MDEWKICIWCGGDSYRVDSRQNSLWINGCDRSDWAEYKCEVCGCRFLSGVKYINFNKILEEGNPDLQKIDYMIRTKPSYVSTVGCLPTISN